VLLSLSLQLVVDLSTADEHCLDFGGFDRVITVDWHEVSALLDGAEGSICLNSEESTPLNLSNFLELQAMRGLR
jgi:hypothetical protein